MSFLPVQPVFGRRGDVDGTRVVPPAGTILQATRMSWRAIGGCHRANIRAELGIDGLAEMLDYLRNGVRLYDKQGYLCWWGYVHEVTVRWGVSEVKISLDRMYNRVKVAYRALVAGEDATEDTQTDWAENGISVSEYGYKELILDAGALVLTETAAEALRDTRLAETAQPRASADFDTRNTNPIADIACRGWWETLSWVHYNQTAGRINYTDTGGGGMQAIGQAATTTAADVTWEDGDDGDYIYSVSGQFLRFSAGQIITVTDSTANNGTYTITEVNINGQRITTAEDVDDDGGVDSITITPQGSRAAQSFTTGASDTWRVISAAIRAMTKGAPVDSLRVHIYNDSAGSPGSSLGNGTLLGSTLDGVMRWRTFTMSSTITLAASTTYWLVTDRTGSNDAENCYHVELCSDAGASGTYKYWDGATWQTRAGMDMPFDVVGGYLASDLIKDTLTKSAFITGVTVVNDAAAVSTLTQIDDQTVKNVVEGLLETGSGNERRLLANVDEYRTVTVYEEPSAESTATRYRRNRHGELVDRYGIRVEPQRVGEIAGNWLESEDIRAIATAGSDLADAARAFVEEIEWTASGNAVRILARGARDVWQA